MQFATPQELRLDWVHCPVDLTDEQLNQALENASVWLATLYPALGNELPETAAKVVRLVVIGMVKRSFMVGRDEGVKSITDTQGPFSTSKQFANPEGSLYITKQERQLLEKALANIGNAYDDFACIESSGW